MRVRSAHKWIAVVALFAAGAACNAAADGADSEDSNDDKSGVTSCNGLYGTTPASDGEYDATEFGCWVDTKGNSHSDPGDNCIPTCLSTAQKSLCKGMSGPSCERSINWYTADAARFGCMTRLQVTNEKNGKSVVVVALDYGPNCKLENAVNKPLLDMSGAATQYLFGGEVGYKDGAHVHVDVVDASTPLGPVTSSSVASSSSSSASSSSSSGSASSGAGGGSSCSHGECTQGAALSSSCDACAGEVCASDGYCCSTAWDGQCVGEAGSICGKSCGGSSSSSSSSASSSASSSSSSGSGGASSTSASASTGSGMACGSDGDCNPGNDGSGLICVSGQCVPGCHSNAQCPGVTTCKNGMCK